MARREVVTDHPPPPDDLRGRLAPHVPALVCLGFAVALLVVSLGIGFLFQTKAPPVLTIVPVVFLVWMAYRMWRG